LGSLLVGDRIAERGHLLSAIQDLSRDFGRRPQLVFAQIHQGRGFFGADAAFAVAMCATLVAKQKGAGLLVGLGLTGGDGGGCSDKREDEQKNRGRNHAYDHGVDFLMAERRISSFFGWVRQALRCGSTWTGGYWSI
jgi:hypothetical protein